jgi:hypothetical protein
VSSLEAMILPFHCAVAMSSTIPLPAGSAERLVNCYLIDHSVMAATAPAP